MALDLMIPASYRPESLCFEMAIPYRIASRLRMLPSVDFDNQPRFEADKVEDVTIERNLPLELKPLQLLVAERLPEQVFGLGCVGPHHASKRAVAGRDGLAQVNDPLS